MKQLIENSLIRDEILKSIKENQKRRVILLSLDLDILLYLLNKHNFRSTLFENIVETINKNITDIEELNFSEFELLESLYLKVHFDETCEIYTEIENLKFELNSYNSKNENILFNLLDNNKFGLILYLLKGINIWNSYNTLARNMNNEIFIFKLYNIKNKQFRKPTISQIYDNFNSDNINIQNENGDTLLHLAIRKKDKEIVNFCLLNGANPYLKNNLDEGIFENQDLSFWKDIIDSFSIEVSV